MYTLQIDLYECFFFIVVWVFLRWFPALRKWTIFNKKKKLTDSENVMEQSTVVVWT